MLHLSSYISRAVHVTFTCNTTLAQKLLTTTILCCTKLTSIFLSNCEHKQTIAIVNPAKLHIQSSTMEIMQFSYWKHHETNYYEPRVYLFIKVTVKPNSYMALNRMCEIWGFSSSVVEDSGLPACDAVLLHEWSPTFWRTVVLSTCLMPLTLWHSITSQMTWTFYWKSATKLVWWDKLSINECCCRVICLQAIALLR